MKHVLLFIPFIPALAGCGNNGGSDSSVNSVLPSNMFGYTDNLEPRWVSFENMTGAKGRGGMKNNGAKGHACDNIRAGSDDLAATAYFYLDSPGSDLPDLQPVKVRTLKLKLC